MFPGSNAQFYKMRIKGKSSNLEKKVALSPTFRYSSS